VALVVALAAATTGCTPGHPSPGGGQRPGTISTVAGSLGVGRATDVAIMPTGVAAHGSFVYVSEPALIRRIDLRTGRQRVIAGTGHQGTTGDGGPATEARVTPGAVDVDGDGNVVFLDTGSSVRRIDRRTGTIETLFGRPSYPPPPGPLNSAIDLTVDATGNVFVSDGAWLVVRWEAATDTTSVVAGSGTSDDDGIPATEARLDTLGGIVTDEAGNTYVAEQRNHRVRRVDPQGIITTVAGTGEPVRSGDGGPATRAGVPSPADLAIAPDGDLLIGEDYGNRIRRVDNATGIIATTIGAEDPGYSGDGGPALAARFSSIAAFAVDPADGSVIVADGGISGGNNRIRRVDGADGTVSTVAGSGGMQQSGDGGRATRAQIVGASNLELDSHGDLYLVDGATVRRVDRRTNVISTAVGAPLVIPAGLAFDDAGNLFVADLGGHVIRRVDAETGVVSTVAGNGTYGGLPLDDGQQATEVALGLPSDVAVADDGTLYIADDGLGRIFRVDAQGVLTAAPGSVGHSRSNLLLDARGGLYVSDGWMTVQRIDLATGEVTVVLDMPSPPLPGDSDDLTRPSVPRGLALGSDGALFVALSFDHRVVRVDPVSGAVTAVAGTGTAGFSGDGGPAGEAELGQPVGLAIDRRGHLYISEALRVRRVAGAAPPS
jgi:sugar lactone lactonase YvrE